MMLRSDGLCYNPIDLQQFAMQDRSLKPPEDVLACPRPLIERRLKPQNDQVLKCPRCDSLNTKFCYFNNYSLSQPRHFCKNCRRYWTKGGALRNVPVGGGCRKNKRAKQRIVEQSSTGHQNESGPSVTHGGDGTSCQPLSDNLSGPAPNSVYYNLASKGDEMNLAYAQAQAQVLRLAEQPGLTTRNSGLFGAPGNSQLTSFPHSTLASLSSHISSLGGLHSLRSGLMGLDFGGTVRGDQENLDFSAILDPVPPLTVASSATSTALSEVGIHPYNLALDALNGMEHEGQWKAQQKMVLNPTENRNIGNRQMFSYENQTVESLRNSHLRPAISSLSPCRKVEEDCCHPSEWQAGQEGLFTTAPDSTIYCWNNGAWADLSGYTPSATSFL